METFEWSAQETEIYIRTTAACVDQTPRGYPCLGWGLQDNHGERRACCETLGVPLGFCRPPRPISVTVRDPAEIIGAHR